MPDDAEDFLRGFEARIDTELAQADQLRSAMASTGAAHGVRDGAIEVTVDSAGGLSGLYLSEAALGLTPAELAREILDCSRTAQAMLAQQQAAMLLGAFGVDPEPAEPGDAPRRRRSAGAPLEGRRRPGTWHRGH